jgi:hypothetical protein
MNTTTLAEQALALAHLKYVLLDLTTAHEHALAAATGLSGARHQRAIELAGLIADALAFTRRLSTVIEGDLRADV